MWQVIYFNKVETGWTLFNSSGSKPLKTLKMAMHANARYLRAFHGIYTTKSQLQGGYFTACNDKMQFNNVDFFFHEDIVRYLRTIDSDPQFCVKIISSLPKQITEKYYQERNKQGYEIPLNQGHLTRASKLVGPGHVSQMVEPKPAAIQDEESNKFELLGRTLNTFPTLEIKYSDEHSEILPKIFFLLTTFFKINEKHLKSEGLFRVNGDRQKIDELSVHL